MLVKISTQVSSIAVVAPAVFRMAEITLHVEDVRINLEAIVGVYLAIAVHIQPYNLFRWFGVIHNMLCIGIQRENA